MSDNPIKRLSPALREVTRWLRETGTPYVVIGGVAVALTAKARNTKDVDAVVLVAEEQLDSFIASAAQYGLVPRISNPVPFARDQRMLLLTHAPSKTKVDISIGALAFEQLAIQNARTITAQGIEVRIPTIDDLIVMKAVASRPHDLADIDTLLNEKPEVDCDRIRALVAEFEEAMERPDLLDRLEPLLVAKRTKRKNTKNE